MTAKWEPVSLFSMLSLKTGQKRAKDAPPRPSWLRGPALPPSPLVCVVHGDALGLSASCCVSLMREKEEQEGGKGRGVFLRFGGGLGRMPGRAAAYETQGLFVQTHLRQSAGNDGAVLGPETNGTQPTSGNHTVWIHKSESGQKPQSISSHSLDAADHFLFQPGCPRHRLRKHRGNRVSDCPSLSPSAASSLLHCERENDASSERGLSLLHWR